MLKQLCVPLLALFGGADTVVPVDPSVERFRASRPDELLTLRVLPGGDHRIQTAGEAFVAGYLAAIVDFIVSTVG